MLKMADKGISFDLVCHSESNKINLEIFGQTVTVGGAVPKLLVCPRVILAITCTKFGRNLLKHCEAIASCPFLHEIC